MKAKQLETIQQVMNGQKAISTSAAKTRKTSFREFLKYYDKDSNERKLYFDFGNALELYLISPEEFKEKVFVMDESKRPVPDKDYKTAANRDWKASIIESNGDKYIIPAIGKESMATILELQAMAEKHPVYSDLVLAKDMNYQDAFEWICPISGYKRYARPDLFSKERGIIVDIKTYDKEFEKSARDNDWFFQAIDHIEGALHSGKMEVVKEYYWFAFCKSDPYYVDCFQFNFDEAMKADESYKSVFHSLRDDFKNEDWQDVVWRDSIITEVRVPNWYK